MHRFVFCLFLNNVIFKIFFLRDFLLAWGFFNEKLFYYLILLSYYLFDYCFNFILIWIEFNHMAFLVNFMVITVFMIVEHLQLDL